MNKQSRVLWVAHREYPVRFSIRSRFGLQHERPILQIGKIDLTKKIKHTGSTISFFFFHSFLVLQSCILFKDERCDETPKKHSGQFVVTDTLPHHQLRSFHSSRGQKGNKYVLYYDPVI